MSIKKIAQITGVSPSTVSRVLNNPEYRCSQKGLRERIWKAAIDMNYTPNEAARNLKKGVAAEKTFFINVLMTRTDANQTDPFFTELLRVVESQIHNELCILSNIWYNPLFSNDKKCKSGNLQKVIDEMVAETQGHADGLVIIGKCNKEALKIWKSKYKSIVSINRNSTNYEVDEVTCDGKKIAAIAVEHLISLGHTEIAYVGEVQNEARYKGFVNTLQNHNLELEPSYVIRTRQTEKEGYEASQIFLSMEEPPSAIYCANDITAIGLLKGLSREKKYHPSVISSDDIEQSQNMKPMLTTVKLPKEEMGQFAIMFLLDRIKGKHESVTRIELEGKLMVRESCHSLS